MARKLEHRKAAETRGRRSERFAALLLACKFYRVIGKRVKTRAGELDLIAMSPSGVLCFVEVKARGARKRRGRGCDRSPTSTHRARGGALLGCTTQFTPQRRAIRRDIGHAAPLATPSQGCVAARFVTVV